MSQSTKHTLSFVGRTERSMGAPPTRSTLSEAAVFRRSIAGVHRNLTNYHLNSIRYLMEMLVPIEFRSNSG
jgi:hypothetical protein